MNGIKKIQCISIISELNNRLIAVMSELNNLKQSVISGETPCISAKKKGYKLTCKMCVIYQRLTKIMRTTSDDINYTGIELNNVDYCKLIDFFG